MTPAEEMQRELGQLAADVAERLDAARRAGQKRAVDFLSGQMAAYKLTLNDLTKHDRRGRP